MEQQAGKTTMSRVRCGVSEETVACTFVVSNIHKIKIFWWHCFFECFSVLDSVQFCRVVKEFEFDGLTFFT